MLILGSTSPYRRELLQRLHLDFEVVAPGVDETPYAGETPRALACRLALAKAQSVAELYPSAVVIGSDQVADLHGEPIGKPLLHDIAVAQLRRMSGQEVIFQTAVAVVCKATGFAQTDLAPVRVQFRSLEDAEIEAYRSLTLADLSAWDVRLLHRLDVAVRSILIGSRSAPFRRCRLSLLPLPEDFRCTQPGRLLPPRCGRRSPNQRLSRFDRHTETTSRQCSFRGSRRRTYHEQRLCHRERLRSSTSGQKP